MVASCGGGTASASASSQGATPMRRSHEPATFRHAGPFAEAKFDVPDLMVVLKISVRHFVFKWI
jgi:hypothetical protein